MLMAELEMRPKDLSGKSMGAMLIALGGLIAPLLVGVGIGWFFFTSVFHFSKDQRPQLT
jgi:hypothetical protein